MYIRIYKKNIVNVSTMEEFRNAARTMAIFKAEKKYRQPHRRGRTAWSRPLQTSTRPPASPQTPVPPPPINNLAEWRRTQQLWAATATIFDGSGERRASCSDEEAARNELLAAATKELRRRSSDKGAATKKQRRRSSDEGAATKELCETD